MAIKYYCDFCHNEILPPTPVSSRPISNIDFIDAVTKKSATQMGCVDCTVKIKEFLEEIKKENKVINLGKDLNIKIK